jgi:hypothetical protein
VDVEKPDGTPCLAQDDSLRRRDHLRGGPCRVGERLPQRQHPLEQILDLIKDRTLVAEDGNHYKVYESNFESTVISLEDDEYRVRIYREENLPDRFSQLWDDLNPD